MIRIYASEDGFDELQRLVNDIHQLKNPGMWWDMREMDDLERREQLQRLLDMMEEQLK